VGIEGRKVGLGVNGAGLGGLPVAGIPLLLPQITLGTLAGTQVALRGSPEVAGFSFFGIGINHNPGFWMEKAQLPFGINSSINGAWTKMTYGDFMEFTAWNAGVTASRLFGFRFLNVAPFVSLGMESSKLEVSYETEFNGADGKPLKVSFESEGENSFRMTMGSKVRLPGPWTWAPATPSPSTTAWRFRPAWASKRFEDGRGFPRPFRHRVEGGGSWLHSRPPPSCQETRCMSKTQYYTATASTGSWPPRTIRWTGCSRWATRTTRATRTSSPKWEPW
jgi:hypothetical protein